MRTHALLAIAVAMSLVSCDQLGIADSGPSELDVSIRIASVAETVSSVVCQIDGPGIDTPITTQLALTDDSARATVTVPAGADRTFTIEAFDAKGIKTHGGSATVDVDETLSGDVEIVLEGVTHSVPIEGKFAKLAITVGPADHGLTVGDSTQYTATVTKDGVEVESPSITWASTNPSVASVTSTGLVRALAVGTVDIVANHGGVAGKAALTVSQ